MSGSLIRPSGWRLDRSVQAAWAWRIRLSLIEKPGWRIGHRGGRGVLMYEIRLAQWLAGPSLGIGEDGNRAWALG